MRPRRTSVTRVIVGLGLLLSAPVAARAQRPEPAGARTLPVSTRTDAQVRPPIAARLERDERILLGAVVGAVTGAAVAYVITQNRTGTAGGNTSDVHELDFMVYVVAVPVGALLGALFGGTSGAP